MVVYVGEDASVLFQFIVDGEFVTPSAATYTVRDNAGQPIASLTDKAIAVGSTEAVITVPAAQSTVANGLDFENRTVVVKFTYNSDVYIVRKSYRVSPWRNYVCGPADVRRELGLLAHELQDDEIDLDAAYLVVRDRLGQSLLDDALAAGNSAAVNANLAIACWAAFQAVPALQLRAAQLQADDNMKFQRLQKIDFEALASQVRDKYEFTVTSLDPTFQATDVSLLVVATPTDAVTGA